ncbi:alpha-E domain-containing protein [Arenibaculum pallidiluteum]|uniref:alpha-E domain-containing protein n=1 Tax=Arenibaculum pallidiluteum TaxID=2812559 RepID=UPI001A957D68|nr:alpha-E domain-containing protein [Arenibaculum pallidiluteum]
MTTLLARYADCIFWLARYMERAENLARLLDVHETFSRDHRGRLDYSALIRINADEATFAARGVRPSAENVIAFYVTDASNPNSIISSVRAARENARILRPLISTEMWSQINVFYNRLLALEPREATRTNLARFCNGIKESCQTHAGVVEGTYYRDQGWYFYHLGKTIERADQTTRLLDIKYHALAAAEDGAGSAQDLGQWHALLRSVAGYHAFRRVHPRGMTPALVAGFILLDQSFPRSLHTCARQVDGLLNGLRSRYGLRGGSGALERLDEIRAVLGSSTADALVARGLHSFLDWVQLRLIDVTREIGTDFFGYAAPAVASQTQMQG